MKSNDIIVTAKDCVTLTAEHYERLVADAQRVDWLESCEIRGDRTWPSHALSLREWVDQQRAAEKVNR